MKPIGNECQCPACAAIFTSPRAFDIHQVWLGKGEPSTLLCLPPAEIGIVERPRRGGTVWSFDSAGEKPCRVLRKTAIATRVRKFGVLDDPAPSDTPEGGTVTTEPKQRLLDKLTEVGAKGLVHTSAIAMTDVDTIAALVRKGVVVVRPTGEKDTLRVWLSGSAPVL